MRNPIGLLIILLFLLGSCTVMTGDVSHWPATSLAVVAIVALKMANDRVQLLRWPMEFLLASAVTMIVISLGRLYFLEPVF